MFVFRVSMAYRGFMNKFEHLHVMEINFKLPVLHEIDNKCYIR